MRIVQLIDSLDAGGAERMAVNYANGLASQIECSALVVTRKEGPLSSQLRQDVPYLFLGRNSTFDFAALWKFVSFLKTNKVHYVHAHSTSFLFAVMAKFFVPSFKIIWHDHYGNSEYLHKRPSRMLRTLSRFFWGTIAVNHILLEWGKRMLHNQNIVYLPNFVGTESESSGKNRTTLHGTLGKRVICLANLRKQKGHRFLLEVASVIVQKHPEWTFHLVGKDFNDEYSAEIRNLIQHMKLESNVFIYGSRSDITNILKQSDIAVLTSISEGLPVALLEYGLHELPVVVTSVGEIPNIMSTNHGIIVSSGDKNSFVQGLESLIEDPVKRGEYATSFSRLIYSTFVENVVLQQYLDWIKASDKWS